MAKFEVRQVRMEDGEVLYVVTDDTGVPNGYATRFMLSTMRSQAVSSGTIRNKMIGIRNGIRLLHRRGIDIEQRIEAGQFLSAEELAVVAQECRKRQDGEGQINSGSAATYYRAFTDYFAFRTDEVLGYVDQERRRRITKARDEFQARAKAQAPRQLNSLKRSDSPALTIEQRELFLRVIRPEDPGNPFKEKLRVRNFAILALAYGLGPRSGEILGLKRKDYDNRFDPPMITIHRRADDPDEIRKEPALAKTLGRTLPVEGLVGEALEAWLQARADRVQYPEARKHPYIFTEVLGKPLAARSLRNIYYRLRKMYPELGGIVNHLLRHDANHRWTADSKEKGTSYEESVREQRYAFGWADESTMPSRYSRGEIEKGAGKMMTKLQRDMITPKQPN